MRRALMPKSGIHLAGHSHFRQPQLRGSLMVVPDGSPPSNNLWCAQRFRAISGLTTGDDLSRRAGGMRVHVGPQREPGGSAVNGQRYREEVPVTPGERVRELAARTSIEVVPGGTESLSELAEQLGAGTRVYITAVPGADPESVVRKAESVIAAGLTAVPHIAARNLPGVPELDRLVARLTQVGVTDVLLIAGSAKRPAGDLDSSLAVLSSGVLERHGIRRVDVAGHPEGSPDITPEQVMSALQYKQKWAGDRGVEMCVVSQFAFGAEVYLTWASSLRSQGIELPVIVGLPGLAKTATLVKYGLSCGVGPSLAVLRKQAGSMLRLAGGRYTPDPVVQQIAESLGRDDHNIVGLHFFPFGALERTAHYIAGLRNGR